MHIIYIFIFIILYKIFVNYFWTRNPSQGSIPTWPISSSVSGQTDGYGLKKVRPASGATAGQNELRAPTILNLQGKDCPIRRRNNMCYPLCYRNSHPIQVRMFLMLHQADRHDVTVSGLVSGIDWAFSFSGKDMIAVTVLSSAIKLAPSFTNCKFGAYRWSAKV